MFIVIEGLPGAGKSTLSSILEQRLIGIKIPELVINKPIHAHNKFYLNNDLIKSYILKLYSNEYVVIDRYYYSTLAFYYSSDKVLGTNFFNEINNTINHSILSGDIIEPDLIIFLNIDIKTSVLRQGVKNTGTIWMNTNFLLHLKKYYDALFFKKNKTTQVYRIDALSSIELVVSKSLYAIENIRGDL